MKSPSYSKIDESSETSRNSTEFYESSKSKPDLTAKSNAQGEETKLILYLGGFRTRSGVVTIINIVSKELSILVSPWKNLLEEALSNPQKSCKCE